MYLLPRGNKVHVWLQTPDCVSVCVCLSKQAVPSNNMFYFCFFVPFVFLTTTKPCLQFLFVSFFGYLFCSSLRLNSQSSRDKVPAPRLAPHVSWNNLDRRVLLGAHPLNPGLTHLFIELSPPLLPSQLNTTHPLAAAILFPLASDLCKQPNTLQT